MKNKPRTALIIGMARSGIASAKLLYKGGWHVIINDIRPEIPGLFEALSDIEVEVALGKDPVTLYEGVELIVVSPIIPMTRDFLVEARRRGIEVISEIELGFRYSRGDFICVTGTNGKTTCTALTGEMFKARGAEPMRFSQGFSPVAELTPLAVGAATPARRRRATEENPACENSSTPGSQVWMGATEDEGGVAVPTPTDDDTGARQNREPGAHGFGSPSLKPSGRKTWVLGNIGTAISEYALDTRDGDAIVAETAALQLEGNIHFRARAAGVCNITPDHLDHFGTMDAYIAAKAKILDNQSAEDVAVLNWDDPIVRGFAARTPARVLYFSRREEVPAGMFLRSDTLICRLGGADWPLLRADEIRIPGAHNLENAMLCSLLALSQGVPPEAVRLALNTFPGVEHRIEHVRTLEGVEYINDSKGTNPASTLRAIEAMDRPITLILGGYDKGADFSELFAAMGNKVKACVVLGATADKILAAAKSCPNAPPMRRAPDFASAVRKARELASPGEVVLLSPACASWDMFEDFEARGAEFKRLVNAFEGK